MILNSFQERLKNELLAKRIMDEQDMVGCTKDEVQQIMKAQNVSWLPPIYIDFLLLLGNNTSKLWWGSRYRCDHLMTLRQDTDSLIQTCGNPIQLPDKAFVLLIEHNINFYWFSTENVDDDPVVYGFAPEPYFYGEMETLSTFLFHY